ncbi:Ras- protein Rab-4B [Serendipita sp. 411]|nr:Ras- protein Rab-4B [Serendipita sp. 411]
MPYSNNEDATEMVEAYDFLLKFIIIGEAGTGKSCLLNHFIQNTFKQHSQHTIGVEFSSRTINIGEKRIKLQLWDTAGQERFRSVTRSYYRGAAGALLVYDITNRKSFENLSRWLADARALASPQLVTVLVGCKSDREDEREVEWAEASRWAAENGRRKNPSIHERSISHPFLLSTDLHFLETSALTGDNVESPFLLAARSILLSIESGQLDPEKQGSGVSYGDRGLRRISSASRMSFLGDGERRSRRRDTIFILRPVKKVARGECCK